MARGDPESVVLEALRPALEEAVGFARRLAAEEGKGAVPSALRPLLKLQRLSTGSLRTTRAALDSDDELRLAVAEQAQPVDPTALPWAWLTRSAGWDQQLEALVVAAAEAERTGRHEQAERSAQRRLQQLETKLRSTEEALTRSQAEVERLRDRLSHSEEAAARALEQADTAQAALAARIEELDRNARRAQRAEASLGTARAAGRDLQAEVEALRAEVRALRAEAEALRAEAEALRAEAEQRGSGSSGAPVTGAEIEEARAAVRAAAVALGLIGPPDIAMADVDRRATPVAGRGTPAPTVRRRPPRPGRGLHADTPEGVLDLLSRPGMQVLVDGYNVAKQQWPALDVHLQRERLLACLAGLAARAGTVIDVVFDGADVTVWRRGGPGSPWVRTAFSPPGVEADDEILRRVAATPDEAEVVVVTSDRRVRDGAAGLGAAVVPSELLGRLLG